MPHQQYPKKSNLTTTNKHTTALICSAEVINSYNLTFCIISLQLQLLAFLSSPRPSTALCRCSPLPTFCSLLARPDPMTRCPVKGTPQEQANPQTATQAPPGSQGCFPGAALHQQLLSPPATAMVAARQSRHPSKRD